jgi:hypothetical protein
MILISPSSCVFEARRPKHCPIGIERSQTCLDVCWRIPGPKPQGLSERPLQQIAPASEPFLER